MKKIITVFVCAFLLFSAFPVKANTPTAYEWHFIFSLAIDPLDVPNYYCNAGRGGNNAMACNVKGYQLSRDDISGFTFWYYIDGKPESPFSHGTIYADGQEVGKVIQNPCDFGDDQTECDGNDVHPQYFSYSWDKKGPHTFTFVNDDPLKALNIVSFGWSNPLYQIYLPSVIN
jgi:hypothetical protein